MTKSIVPKTHRIANLLLTTYSNAAQCGTDQPPPMTKPIPVRFPAKTKADLDKVAKASGLTVSALIRLSVERNLPAMAEGRISIPVTAGKAS